MCICSEKKISNHNYAIAREKRAIIDIWSRTIKKNTPSTPCTIYNHDTRRAGKPAPVPSIGTRLGPIPSPPRTAASSRPAAPPTRAPSAAGGGLSMTTGAGPGAGAGAVGAGTGAEDLGAPDLATVAAVFLVFTPPPLLPRVLATAAGPPLRRLLIVFSFSGARGSLGGAAAVSESTISTPVPAASASASAAPLEFDRASLALASDLDLVLDAFVSASRSSSASRDVRLRLRWELAPAALLVDPVRRGTGAGAGAELVLLVGGTGASTGTGASVGSTIGGGIGGGSKTGTTLDVNAPGG